MISYGLLLLCINHVHLWSFFLIVPLPTVGDKLLTIRSGFVLEAIEELRPRVPGGKKKTVKFRYAQISGKSCTRFIFSLGSRLAGFRSGDVFDDILLKRSVNYVNPLQ